MLSILKLGAGYRTYIVAAALALQALAKLLGGDFDGLGDILKSDELTQVLEGGGLASIRSALPKDLARILAEIARKSGVRVAAVLMAVASGASGCGWLGGSYDTDCLTRCARQCELECRHSQGGTGDSVPVPDHSPSGTARAASSAASIPSQ